MNFRSSLTLIVILFFSLAMQSPLPKVFVIGDSISIQYGPYLEQYSQGLWEYDRKREEGKSANEQDLPVGANGGDSKMVLEYLKSKIQDPSFKPDFLLLNCGLHDIKTNPTTKEKQVTLDDYRKNLATIYKLLNENGIAMAWIRTTPVVDEQHNTRQSNFHRFAEDVKRYNAIADEVFQSRNVPIIDLHQFTLNLGEGIFIDHVHYGEETRARQAAYIAGFLNKINPSP
ncbi:MAG: SGNH/GDSL hydrolase family protein [Cyclobacteriaceae bacterium]